MKKIIVIILYFIPIVLFAQDGFIVKVNLKDLGQNKVRVTYQINDKLKRDTLITLKENLIIWEGKTAEPQIVTMEVMDSSLYLRNGKAVKASPTLMFLLTNTEIRIKGSAKEVYAASIDSKDEDVKIYELYHQKNIPISREIWALETAQNSKKIAKDTVGITEINDKIKDLRKKDQSLKLEFLNQYPQAFASIYLLQSLFVTLPISELDRRLSLLDEKYKGSIPLQNLHKRVESYRKTAIGMPVIPFSQVGYDGKIVDIAALKGKVILIDFWGSWCVPCRMSHPGLKVLYEKYKSKGFEIVGVANENVSGKNSLTDQNQKWRKAIETDGTNWLNILNNANLKDIIKEYDIAMYPTKFLIDQNGNFVLKVIGASQEQHDLLEQKLEELLP